MKKITALVLVVLMLIVAVPFGAFAATEYVVINNAQELANIKDGKYWLAADINLSAANWTKIAEFSGILDGNGHTITVPQNTVLFDTVTGTIKNVNLVSASKVTLENDDISTFKTPETEIHEAGAGIGVLANVAKGATIENVHTNVQVLYNQLSASVGLGVHVGGLVGIALADYTVDGNNLVINRETVIRNCSTDGLFDVDWKWDNSLTGDKVFKNGFGGIVGYAYGNVVIEKCLSSVDYEFYKNRARTGGVVGQCRSLSYGQTYDNYREVIKPVEITNCLVNGNLNKVEGYALDVVGGITGYNIGVTITNCVFAGDLNNTDGGQVRHLFAYSNVGNTEYGRTVIQGCLSVGTASERGTATNEVIYGKGRGIFALNNYLVAGQTITIETSGSAVPDMTTQNVGNTEYDTEALAVAAFVAANSDNFKLVEGEITLIQPTFTPKNNPPEYVTLYENDNKNYVTTGKDLERDEYNNESYAGFIQFSTTEPSKARIVMAISDDELENATYESFDMVIFVVGDNGATEKSLTINSKNLDAYLSVKAAGVDFIADNCQMFGLVVDFGTFVPESIEVSIVAEGAAESMYTASWSDAG